MMYDRFPVDGFLVLPVGIRLILQTGFIIARNNPAEDTRMYLCEEERTVSMTFVGQTKQE